MNEWHNCHFCGEYVSDGLDHKGERHWLSDCRPDLVEHEPGELCTWRGDSSDRSYDCYAYQNRETNAWTNDHVHFYTDGPM